jgi:hypothetical protein
MVLQEQSAREHLDERVARVYSAFVANARI